MTIGEPRVDHDPNLAKTPQKGALLRRICDWFWRGSALARVRAAMPEPGPRAVIFARRAQASIELAQNTLAPAEPSEVNAEGNACELYRQASFWAMCALLAKSEPTLPPEDSESIWGSLPDALLVQAASDEQRVHALRAALRSGTFVYFAEMPLGEQKLYLAELRKLSQLLQAKLAERSVALDAVYLQRAWRLAFLGLLALCIALSPAVVKKVLEARSELSSGKPWRASSKYEGGCTSPSQTCAENTGYFFHTQEESNPWIEFDLGKTQTISKVHIENRSDCCADRADPLTIEVSTDQKHWRKVAHHEGQFTTWDATFNPANGRYLRIRLLKLGILHFASVHIY